MGFKTRDEETDMSDDAPKVKWRKFEYVVENNDNGGFEKRKLKMVDKITSPGEMFSCLKNLLQTYPAHQSRANWQNKTDASPAGNKQWTGNAGS